MVGGDVGAGNDRRLARAVGADKEHLMVGQVGPSAQGRRRRLFAAGQTDPQVSGQALALIGQIVNEGLPGRGDQVGYGDAIMPISGEQFSGR